MANPLSISFEASQLERERGDSWIKSHGLGVKDCPADMGTEWRFVGTGIGTKVSVRCLRCHQTYDVTDYGSW